MTRAASIPVANIQGYPTEWFENSFPDCRAAFTIEAALPIMEKFASNECSPEAFYIWVAFAVRGYRQSQRRGHDEADLPPARVVELLGSIESHARELERLLRVLDESSGAAAANGNIPKSRAFARAHQHVARAFDEGGGTGLWPDHRIDPEMWPAFEQWKAFLNEIGDRAEQASRIVASNRAASGGAGPRLVGLGGFVSVLSSVWLGMTGKAPSAEKVYSTLAGEDPPFVRFVSDVATAAALPQPTRKMVKNLLTPP